MGGAVVGCSERPKKSLGKPYKHVGAGGLLRSATMMDLIPKPYKIVGSDPLNRG